MYVIFYMNACTLLTSKVENEHWNIAQLTKARMSLTSSPNARDLSKVQYT